MTGFGALGGLLTVALLVAGPLTAVPALAMELPVGSRFLGRGSDGWFWYGTLPILPLPNPVPFGFTKAGRGRRTGRPGRGVCAR